MGKSAIASLEGNLPEYETTGVDVVEVPNVEGSTPAEPTVKRFFWGDDGLRAGWGVLLYIVLMVLVGVALFAVVTHFHWLPKPTKAAASAMSLTAKKTAIGKTMELAVYLIPALLMSLIEKRPFRRYGLTSRRAVPDFLMGLFWGFVALSTLVGGLYATHSIAFDGFLLGGTTALLFALKWGLVFLLVGVGEEYLFRGYLQYTVARGVAGIVRAMDPGNKYGHAIGFWVAAGMFSVGLFMAAHLGNGGETALGILSVGLAGVVFAFSLWRTGSLWWGIGMHTSWDWAQSYFYGTADSGTIAQGRLLSSHPIGSTMLSGGTAGPEGSVLLIPALLLVALVIHLTLPRRAYVLTPDQAAPTATPLEA